MFRAVTSESFGAVANHPQPASETFFRRLTSSTLRPRIRTRHHPPALLKNRNSPSRDQLGVPLPLLKSSVCVRVRMSYSTSLLPDPESPAMKRPSGDQRGDHMSCDPGRIDTRFVFRSTIWMPASAALY